MENLSISKISIISFLFFGYLWAQDIQSQDAGASEGVVVEPTSISNEAKTDILGFGAFKLGSDYDGVDELFGAVPYQFLLKHKGDEVEPSFSSIDTYKNDFFDSFHLQFDKNKQLYFIKIQVNPSNWNFNEIYTMLKKKYGMPQSLSFETIKWTKAQKTLSLSRKGEIRYLAEDLLKQQLEASKNIETNKDKPISLKEETTSRPPNDARVKSGVENIHTYNEIMELY